MVDTEHLLQTTESIHEPTDVSVRQVRRHVRALLTRWDLDAERIDDALLVVEELAANVVDHAHTEFRLLLELEGSTLQVALRDGSTRWPRAEPRDSRAVRGRGLQLVDTLAAEWGCERHENGKTVWAVLAV